MSESVNEITNILGIKSISISNLSEETTISIDGIFLTMNVYEDIFSHYTTARLTIQDSHDLPLNLPIIGGEKVNVTFASKNDDKPVTQEFKVYKLEKDTNPTVSNINNKIIILFLTSSEQLIDETSSISKKISGDVKTSIQNIISTYMKSNKKLDVGKTTNSLDFICNFWTPSKVLNYISKVTHNNKISDFLFFENKTGFNFKSISELMNEDASHELMFRDDISSKYDVNVISQYTINKYFSLLELAKNGSLGNTVFQWHDDRYGFNKTETDFETVSAVGTNLGKSAKFDKSFANNSNNILTYKDSNVVSVRDQLIKSLGSYHLLLQLPGDSTKTVGQIYNIEYREKIRESLEMNKMLTGKWFVTNINHEFDRNGTYQQTIKVVKNAFFNFKETTPVKGKTNI